MQHYLNCGIGFQSNLISKTDWDKLANIPHIEKKLSLDVNKNSFDFTIVPFTEDVFDIDAAYGWSSIVLRDSQRLGNMQKSFSFEDISKYKNDFFPLSKENHQLIYDELLKY